MKGLLILFFLNFVIAVFYAIWQKTKKNVNNIEISHLHLGLQLIFDESQKESNNEIWINLYPLTMLLKNNQSEVYREASTKEYYRKYQMELIN